jgi:hypothetical protein
MKPKSRRVDDYEADEHPTQDTPEVASLLAHHTIRRPVLDDQKVLLQNHSMP